MAPCQQRETELEDSAAELSLWSARALMLACLRDGTWFSIAAIRGMDVTAVTCTVSARPREMQEPWFPAPPNLRVVSVEGDIHHAGLPARVIHPDPAIKVVLAPTAHLSGGRYRLE